MRVKNSVMRRWAFRLDVRWGTILLLSIVCPTFSGIHAQSKGKLASAAPAAAGAAASVQASNGSQPRQPTAPTPATAQKIATLPMPFPPGLIQGIDVAGQSRGLLTHLGEVTRYYRMAVVPIQKVGEPTDVLYAQQTEDDATQAAQLAFRAARSQAAFLIRIPGKGSDFGGTASAEASHTTQVLRNLSRKITDLQKQNASLDQQLASARPAQRGQLKDQKGDVEGQLKLYTAALGTVQKVLAASSSASGELQGRIDDIQHSVPELANAEHKPIATSVDSVGNIRDAGVTTQATVLFQLLSTERAIDERVQELRLLHSQAEVLRAPLIKVLGGIMAESQSIQNDTGSSSDQLRAKRKQYDDLTDAFTTLSDVAVPASQELLLLEQAQSTYDTWRASISTTRKTILHALLFRVISIAVMLALILILGALWRSLATKYVHDVRRRRQILLIRRIVIGFLCGLVLILGFVTQFSSLATFAGFITAGIAVGLQTILLSVAAYFFIVGRYGIRVGDRITVAGVTGEVVEVGLVRFYMLELTGSGTELHSTGRVAVFANSVLFQTGTPLYKQIPGTDFAWHELTVKFKPNTDYGPALATIRGIVESVYATYRESLERQHRNIQGWLDTPIQPPGIESRIQLVDGAQFAVLYPVQLSQAAETDEKIVSQILNKATQDPKVSPVLDGVPAVRSVVKS
ncbi:MAG TPA: mechanosensitive ion channel family protein [Acidobacteriaceae bacterium]|jgi:small-conductance mechanosensitive channel